jgi:hypothetical protein
MTRFRLRRSVYEGGPLQVGVGAGEELVVRPGEEVALPVGGAVELGDAVDEVAGVAPETTAAN